MDTNAKTEKKIPGSESFFVAGKEELKVALIGCGVRGTSALQDIQDAATHLGINLKIAAIGDYLPERIRDAAEKLKISPDIGFSGIDCYKKIVAADIDAVLLATPPAFRPVHFAAAVAAGKHVFMEKPAAVDAPGARSILETGQLAAEKKLTVVAGTQRRYEAPYLTTFEAIRQGAIGDIRAARIWWCQKTQRRFERQPEWNDAEYMVRNWINFVEMSGDHIVEQHIHNIDVVNWFIGRPPEKAIGFGGRARRRTGNQYDFFSVDFDYGQDVHVHGMCRQIDGCYDRHGEYFVGTEGATWATGPGAKGFAKTISVPEYSGLQNPYAQEQLVFIQSILNGQGHNDAESVAQSTFSAILGRISAYTGQMVRYQELTDESAGSKWYHFSMSPGPLDFERGTVKLPQEGIVPLPGIKPDSI